jgi:hypothetical protein
MLRRLRLPNIVIGCSRRYTQHPTSHSRTMAMRRRQLVWWELREAVELRLDCPVLHWARRSWWREELVSTHPGSSMAAVGRSGGQRWGCSTAMIFISVRSSASWIFHWFEFEVWFTLFSNDFSDRRQPWIFPGSRPHVVSVDPPYMWRLDLEV